MSMMKVFLKSFSKVNTCIGEVVFYAYKYCDSAFSFSFSFSFKNKSAALGSFGKTNVRCSFRGFNSLVDIIEYSILFSFIICSSSSSSSIITMIVELLFNSVHIGWREIPTSM
eukprot:428991_1